MTKQNRSRKDRQVTLACVDCSQRNYSTEKSQNLKTERLEIKKFCPHCNNHTLHRETK